MHTPKVWLITGASSGFGNAMAEFILSKGDIVVATLRKPEVLKELATRYPKDRFLVLVLDVTKQADIDRAFAKTKEAFGRLDVVFNNAGSAIFGEVEATPIEGARALFEVNFWGLVNVSRAAVKFFREVNGPGKGGVLLQNSSVSGFIGPPGLAYYCASKHAVEGFSEALASELLPAWNIRVCIVEPGAFKTNTLVSTTVYPAHPAYDESSVTATIRASMDGLTFRGDPYKFSETIYRMVAGDEIPLYLPMGRDALAMLRGRVKQLGEVLSDAAPWSIDLKLKNPGPRL
ncbi:hypothetical protein PAXRUDRAFT_399768 [Paxillus rubicundulus Ve08.2h10]|uniref:NAD-P-binding protein n=1 Tax=Paxillus rubicundulus Ve08.2h10 TaxID=930991 RepID=A0A0D0DR12_9AGAM|nr:hypothetical protein PAXRUDRAFT_399768 [Paxillus rubicundulus Ve08.2h10]